MNKLTKTEKMMYDQIKKEIPRPEEVISMKIVSNIYILDLSGNYRCPGIFIDVAKSDGTRFTKSYDTRIGIGGFLSTISGGSFIPQSAKKTASALVSIIGNEFISKGISVSVGD